VTHAGPLWLEWAPARFPTEILRQPLEIHLPFHALPSHYTVTIWLPPPCSQPNRTEM
jgi:hypothetical protein